MTTTVGTLIQMDFDDLTDAQVLALTEVEMQFHMDRLMARDGVPLPVALPPKPAQPEAQPDVVVFKVGDFMFTGHQQARDVANAINGSSTRVQEGYVPGGSYRDRALKADRPDPVTVEESAVWSAEGWARHGADVKTANAAREAWDKMEEEGRKADKARQECRDHVRRRRADLESDRDTRARWARELARYADLGLGPVEARAALLLAHPSAADWLPPVAPQDAAQCPGDDSAHDVQTGLPIQGDGAQDVPAESAEMPGFDPAMDGDDDDDTDQPAPELYP